MLNIKPKHQMSGETDDNIRNAAQKYSGIELKFEQIIEEFGMTREQFLDACICAGTDYNDSLMSIKRSMIMIKQHNTIENLMEQCKKTLRSVERFDYEFTRSLYMTVINIDDIRTAINNSDILINGFRILNRFSHNYRSLIHLLTLKCKTNDKNVFDKCITNTKLII